MTTDPSEYPARCDASAEGLATLKDRFEDDDDTFGKHIDGGWPPTDGAGNVYPIFFTPDELDDSGKLPDRWNTYRPFAGNLQPIERETWGACNAPLQSWEKRYPEPRYCGRISNSPGEEKNNPTEYTYCTIHKGRDNVKTAEEQMQSGLFVKTVDHLYDKLDPWRKLVGWGTFESLMGESVYEFATERKQHTFDFADEPFVPDDADEDGVLTVECEYPTQYVDAALNLYSAAMMEVQIISVQPRIMYEDREQGEGMMESRTIEAAQLTAPPSEHDPSPQEFKTLETWSEHHLNLPLSRLIRDRPKLLERGGVDTDVDSEGPGASSEDIVLEIDADPDGVETVDSEGSDPNQFEDYQSKSAEIVQTANEGDNEESESDD